MANRLHKESARNVLPMPAQTSAVYTLLFFGLWLAPVHAQSQSRPSEGSQTNTTMTGCVDEQNGLYVLVKGPELKVVANLQADGFPTEGFAKHMGHTITVHGSLVSNTTGATPLFKVRSIEKVSDTCQQQENP